MAVALIELQAITKKFIMGSEPILALNDVSFRVRKGEFCSIAGPSGCGKSTLMNIIGLLDSPESGGYRFADTDVNRLSDDERSLHRNQSIGFVFQNFNLLPRMSALRNVEMPLIYSAGYDKTYSKGKITSLALEALERVALSDRVHHRPNELSGGQRQRVAIARAIVNRPRLLLADEPTGNLDTRAGEAILELFGTLNESGMTVVMVTHDRELALRAPHRIRMLDGRIESDEGN